MGVNRLLVGCLRTKSNMHGKDVVCNGLMAHSLVRWLEQTGISIDAQDRHNLRKQRQDKTVNSAAFHLCLTLFVKVPIYVGVKNSSSCKHNTD